MLSELERLAREAGHYPKLATNNNDGSNWLVASFGRSCIDDKDWIVTTDRMRSSDCADVNMDAKTDAEWYAAISNAFPLLLAAVRAAEARPWLSVKPNDFGHRECAGCQRYGVESEHTERCPFAPLDSALAALKGRT